MNQRVRRVRRVRATDLADMGFCEQKCLLKAIHGEVDTRASADAKAKGRQEHERFHVQVSEHHNRSRGAATDKRCFIATAVYGGDDPRTEQLRRFRDHALVPYWAGRILVRAYYRVSPSIADTLVRYPSLRPIAGRCLDFIRRSIAPTYSKDASHDHARHEHQRD